MNLLNYYPLLPHEPTAAWILIAGGSISVFFIIIFLIREVQGWGKAEPLQLSKPVDNVEALAFGISIQIRKAKDDKDLNKCLEAIKRYENEYQENMNAVLEALTLRDILDIKANQIYGVEELVS